MHGAAERDETWLGRANWLWLIVSGLSTGVWRSIGWLTRKWPRHVTPGGLALAATIAGAAVATVGLVVGPEGMTGWLTAQAAGALLTAALVALVVTAHTRTVARRRRAQERHLVRVRPRPPELEGRHRMMLINDGSGPVLDVRIAVHLSSDAVSHRVFEQTRVAASSSAEFDVINSRVAAHLPFAPDDALIAEWLDHRGALHRREWRLGDNLAWGYPVAFGDGTGDRSMTAAAVRPAGSR